MNSLDRILESIFKQADTKAEKILREANLKATRILVTGEFERTEQYRRYEQTAGLEYMDIENRASSGHRQDRRFALLKMQNDMIDEVINEAKEKILSLPDSEYMDFLFRLYNKNAQPKDGVVRFAPADYYRIHDSFFQRCKLVFPENSLSFSGDMESISHGFVIEYGNIIQNCSIEGIFEAEEQILRDKANEILTISL